MTPDLMGILSIAGPTVGDHLQAAHRLGPAYMKAYAEWYLGPKATSRFPQPPAGLSGHAAALIRDEVKEAAMVTMTTSGVEAAPRLEARKRRAAA